MKEPDSKSLAASQESAKMTKRESKVDETIYASPVRTSTIKSVRNMVNDSSQQVTLGADTRTASELLDLKRAGFKSKMSFKAKSVKSKTDKQIICNKAIFLFINKSLFYLLS